jgi:hypothetical protein
MKRVKLVLTIIVVALLSFNNSYAQSVIGNEPFVVKYIGEKNGYLVFEIAVNETTENGKVLKITDLQEGELFTQLLDTKTKTQVYKIESVDGQTLVFNLQIGNKEYNKSYTFQSVLYKKVSITENTVAKN